MHKMEDATDPVIYKKRDRELKALTRLLPRALDAAGYWQEAEPPRRRMIKRHFTLLKNPDDQFIQVDSRSCGVFAMMYVDRMLYAAPPATTMGDNFIRNYRKWHAARIYHMCRNR